MPIFKHGIVNDFLLTLNVTGKTGHNTNAYMPGVRKLMV